MACDVSPVAMFEKRIVQGYQKLYSHTIQTLTSEFCTVVKVFTPSRKTIQSLHTSENICGEQLLVHVRGQKRGSVTK